MMWLDTTHQIPKLPLSRILLLAIGRRAIPRLHQRHPSCRPPPLPPPRALPQDVGPSTPWRPVAPRRPHGPRGPPQPPQRMPWPPSSSQFAGQHNPKFLGYVWRPQTSRAPMPPGRPSWGGPHSRPRPPPPAARYTGLTPLRTTPTPISPRRRHPAQPPPPTPNSPRWRPPALPPLPPPRCQWQRRRPLPDDSSGSDGPGRFK